MSNSKELKVKYHGKKDKPTRKKNPNVASVSKLGYRDDSPYRSLPYIDIDTPSGRIDMSNTGIPLWANGRILPPYSGIHQFDTTQVKEIPLAQTGLTVLGRIDNWIDNAGKNVGKAITNSTNALLDTGIDQIQYVPTAKAFTNIFLEGRPLSAASNILKIPGGVAADFGLNVVQDYLEALENKYLPHTKDKTLDLAHEGLLTKIGLEIADKNLPGITEAARQLGIPQKDFNEYLLQNKDRILYKGVSYDTLLKELAKKYKKQKGGGLSKAQLGKELKEMLDKISRSKRMPKVPKSKLILQDNLLFPVDDAGLPAPGNPVDRDIYIKNLPPVQWLQERNQWLKDNPQQQPMMEARHGGWLGKYQTAGQVNLIQAALNQANSSFQPSSTRTAVPATVALKRTIDTGEVAANKKAAEEARAKEIASGKGTERMFGLFDIPVTYSGIERQNAQTLGKKKLAAETKQGDVYQNFLELGSLLAGTGALSKSNLAGKSAAAAKSAGRELSPQESKIITENLFYNTNKNVAKKEIDKFKNYLNETYDFDKMTPYQREQLLDREAGTMMLKGISVDDRIANNKRLLEYWDEYKKDRIDYFNSPKFRERVNKQYGEMDDEFFENFKGSLLENLENRPYLRPDLISGTTRGAYLQGDVIPDQLAWDQMKPGHTYYPDKTLSKDFDAAKRTVFHEGRHQLTDAKDQAYYFPSEETIKNNLIHQDLLKTDPDLTRIINNQPGSEYYLSPEEFIVRLDALKRDLGKVGYDYKTMDLTPEILKKYKGLTPREAVEKVAGKNVKAADLTPEQTEAIGKLLQSSPKRTKDTDRLLRWFNQDFLLDNINNKWALFPSGAVVGSQLLQGESPESEGLQRQKLGGSPLPKAQKGLPGKFKKKLADPTYGYGVQWLADWYNNPETQKRLQQSGLSQEDLNYAFENMGDTMISQTYPETMANVKKSLFKDGLKSNKVNDLMGLMSDDVLTSMQGVRGFASDPEEGLGIVYVDPGSVRRKEATLPHELMHASTLDRKIAGQLGAYGYTFPKMKEFYPDLYKAAKKSKDKGAINNMFQAVGSDDEQGMFREIYPYIQSVRYEMGIKPGETITQEMLDNYAKSYEEKAAKFPQRHVTKDSSLDRLLKLYSKPKLIDFMNTVAYNPNEQEVPMARFGGLPMHQVPPGQVRSIMDPRWQPNQMQQIMINASKDKARIDALDKLATQTPGNPNYGKSVKDLQSQRTASVQKAKREEYIQKNPGKYNVMRDMPMGIQEPGIEDVDYEMALLPASLPFKGSSLLGKAAVQTAEILNPLGGFKGGFANPAAKYVGNIENNVVSQGSFLPSFEDLKGFFAKKPVEKVPANQTAQVIFTPPMGTPKLDPEKFYIEYERRLKGLRTRGKALDNMLKENRITGKDILHPDAIKYHGTYSGRPIVEVKMPDLSSEYFYKSTGWGGKEGISPGQWQVYGEHMNDPHVTSSNWFVKGEDYADFYGSKGFGEIANNLDEVLSKKLGVSLPELNKKIYFKSGTTFEPRSLDFEKTGGSKLPPHLPEAYKTGGWLKKYQTGDETGNQGPVRDVVIPMIEAGVNIPEVTYPVPEPKIEKSFSDAFREARKAGLSEFTWRGKKYGTKYSSEVQPKEKVLAPVRGNGPTAPLADASFAPVSSAMDARYALMRATLQNQPSEQEQLRAEQAQKKPVNVPKTLPNKTQPKPVYEAAAPQMPASNLESGIAQIRQMMQGQPLEQEQMAMYDEMMNQIAQSRMVKKTQSPLSIELQRSQYPVQVPVEPQTKAVSPFPMQTRRSDYTQPAQVEQPPLVFPFSMDPQRSQYPAPQPGLVSPFPMELQRSEYPETPNALPQQAPIPREMMNIPALNYGYDNTLAADATYAALRSMTSKGLTTPRPGADLMPDMSMPNFSLPEFNMPDVSIPEVNLDFVKKGLEKADSTINNYGTKIGKSIGKIEDAIGKMSKESYQDFKSGLEMISNYAEDIDVETVKEWALRALEKNGIIDPLPESKPKLKPKVVEEKPQPKSFFEVIDVVPDKGYSENGKLLSYRSQWNNDDGFEYITSGVRKDNSGFEADSSVGVGHFMLDSSANPGTEYSHDYNKSFFASAKKHNDYVPVFTPGSRPGRVIVRYKRANELTEDDKLYSPLRQHVFDEIEWTKSEPARLTNRPHKYIKTVVDNMYKKKYGRSPQIIYKDKDAYSRFSGLSVVFIFKDKYGNTIVRDFAGSINGVMNEGKQIEKDYNLKKGDLTMGYYDVGSFSAKPAAKDNVISSKQWRGFNALPWTGGALIIPTQK